MTRKQSSPQERTQFDFFDLKTPANLFRKLEGDLGAIEKSFQDTRAAFNFFVTAEHLPDWLGRRDLIRQHSILRVVSQIANGAKHFVLKDSRHQSVINTEKARYVEEGYLESGYFHEPLLVQLSPAEADEMGEPRTDALTLARQVTEFWRPYVAATETEPLRR